MPPKVVPDKQTTAGKSILIIPSRINQPENVEGAEETEIAAQITLPHEGGWGWVVVFSAFWSIFLLDGVALTFGSLLTDMTEDLETSESLVAMINSIAIALYLIASPISSAMINRFGFRACVMAGSIICASSLLSTYFLTSYGALCIFYGATAGFGYSLINLACSLVVGFYFERLRAIALSIATCGSSIGTAVMFPINSYLVKIAGWRTVTLLHSGLFGVIFFLGMTFKPLLSLTVTKTTEDPTTTVTYLPNVSTATLKRTPSRMNPELVATATERLFSAVSNANFPTAAAVVEEEAPATTRPGPSGAVSRLTITAQVPSSGITPRQLKQVQSIISRTSVQDKTKRNIELTVGVEEPKPKKRRWWQRLCRWEKHVPQSRPMYRDDVFYGGKLEKLPVYQKSVMDTAADARTGLEYQLAVSRAVTTADLSERRGVFTTAVRRTLATMMDPSLLKKCSFILLCASGFMMNVGFLVPYVFLPDRSRSKGIEEQHCDLFVSVIGFSNTVGRLALGILASKVDPLKVFITACIFTGVGTIASNFYFNPYYQYVCFGIFGFCMAALASLRSIVIVHIYGLEKLTNATGMMFLFQGIGSLISTPVAGELKKHFGYDVAFFFAGAFMLASGLSLIPLSAIVNKETKSNNPEKATATIEHEKSSNNPVKATVNKRQGKENNVVKKS